METISLGIPRTYDMGQFFYLYNKLRHLTSYILADPRSTNVSGRFFCPERVVGSHVFVVTLLDQMVSDAWFSCGFSTELAGNNAGEKN